ncbi:MAG: hypothetical protein ACQESR_17325 [Planctomycetota bacterium]
MSVLAMAPPVPLGGKLFVALLMLGLGAVLFRAVRGPFTGQSFALAVLVSVVTIVALEILLPSRHGPGLHDRGVLAAVVGALSSGVFLRPASRKTGEQQGSREWRLPILALVSGPLLGLFLALLVVLFADVPPVDRGFTFAVCGWMGMIAGLISAVLVAVLAR